MNTTDDEGFNWFKTLECKRCLQIFKSDKKGEIPEHKCIGGIYRSESLYGEYHIPICVKK